MSATTRSTRGSKRKATEDAEEIVNPVVNSKKAVLKKVTSVSKPVHKTDEPFIISIEHCKSWNAFKTRAARVKAALDASTTPSFKVKINDEKPRKGAFVITMEGRAAPILEMLDLTRPFPKLKSLDMDKVIEDIFTVANESK